MPPSDSSFRAPRPLRHGLTLLELLVVVMILAMLAGAAVSLTDQVDSQTRFDDTQTKLNAIRQGIIGDGRLSASREPLHLGYVSDMGELPSSLIQLTTAVSPPSHTAQFDFGTWTPYPFQRWQVIVDDPTPLPNGRFDPTTLNTDAVSIDAWLHKGFRGPYVSSATVSAPQSTTLFLGGTDLSHGQSFILRDGWGNRSSTLPYDPQCGWGWTPATDAITYTSLSETHPHVIGLTATSFGSGGVSDTLTTPLNHFDQDLHATILPDEWSLAHFDLSVTNDTGNTLTDLNAVLLIWTTSGWRRLQSAKQSPMDGATVTFTLPDHTASDEDDDQKLRNLDPLQRIPLGRHVLAILDDNTHPTPDVVRHWRYIDIYPRVTPTVEVTLE